MNSRSELRTSFGLTTARTRKLKLCPSLMLAALSMGTCQPSLAQGAPDRTSVVSTLFQSVRIFDGSSAALSAASDVLIRGNTIERISVTPITVDANANVQVIAANGRVLMPGLIDNHWHATLVRVTPAEAFGDVSYNSLQAGAGARPATHGGCQHVNVRLALATDLPCPTSNVY